jgi:hypothetical protein
MSGLCSSIAARNWSTSVLMPRSKTSNPAPSTLHGANHDGADWFGSGFGEEWTENAHAGLHRVGCEQHLGHEENAVAEVDTHDAHTFDQRLVEHLVGSPAAAKQDVGAFEDLVGEAVVEIVVHLCGEIFVAQGVEINFFFKLIRHFPSTPASFVQTPTVGRLCSALWNRTVS